MQQGPLRQGATKESLRDRISSLNEHLERENPELLGIVRIFTRLDKVARKLGLLDAHASYVTQVSWWPLVSVLGTFSSGKSTFINGLLGVPLQASGNQAVDDKFTVICYGTDATPRVLPGLALDSDPRFPFYKISGKIDKVTAGEGERLDMYLQLKTVNCEAVRGRIFIDSPGFDADEQRTSTLRITDHIIDLSDLVLVFFDARHPEPGAMQDTLDYLVANVLQRPDFNKFLYVLNQIDNAAREDNAEEVVAAWQRALAARGLTAGRFFRIYDARAAVRIENEHLRQRFEARRDADLDAIHERIAALDIERSYRVAAKLEHTARRIREEFVPRLEAARRSWRRRVWILDAVLAGIVTAVVVTLGVQYGWFGDLSADAASLDGATGNSPWLWVAAVVAVVLLLAAHRQLRGLAARPILKRLRKDASLGDHAQSVALAFEKNVRAWKPFFLTRPTGWTVFTRRRLEDVLTDIDRAVQQLNDLYASPSGKDAAGAPIPTAPKAQTTDAAHGPVVEHEDDSDSMFDSDDRAEREPRDSDYSRPGKLH